MWICLSIFSLHICKHFDTNQAPNSFSGVCFSVTFLHDIWTKCCSRFLPIYWDVFILTKCNAIGEYTFVLGILKERCIDGFFLFGAVDGTRNDRILFMIWFFFSGYTTGPLDSQRWRRWKVVCSIYRQIPRFWNDMNKNRALLQQKKKLRETREFLPLSLVRQNLLFGFSLYFPFSPLQCHCFGVWNWMQNAECTGMSDCVCVFVLSPANKIT